MMRIQDKAQFDKENVFGLGQPNTATPGISPAIPT